MLIIIASLYRVMPGRPLGFAPQIAMALFAGSVMSDRKLAFLLPLFSMIFSDVLYEILYQNNICDIPGFYNGQILNYLLFCSITVIGFKMNKDKIGQILAGALVGATFFFIISNFLVWIGGGLDINNMAYPKSYSGLISCYSAAIPFYKGSLLATIIFSGILFGAYQLLQKLWFKASLA
jgi:hypothetical protein